MDHHPAPTDSVILLHGLGRTSRSMSRLERSLREEGYAVVNIGYSSRKHPVEELARDAIGRGLQACRSGGAQRIHFVTHSMGGILLRHFLSHDLIPELGRVVMLAPPNHGSEVVDRLARIPGFARIVGPAGVRLGTAPDSIPNLLGPVSFPVGVIAGTASINPVFSSMVPAPADGTVSVASAGLQGMSAFLAIKASHTFITRNPQALKQTLHFLRTGAFLQEQAASASTRERTLRR